MAEIAAAGSMAKRILSYHEEQPCDSCSQLRSTLAANETELDNLKDALHTKEKELENVKDELNEIVIELEGEVRRHTAEGTEVITRHNYNKDL